ncbi:CMP deaminase [bacterium]|nr:CMP deaminase [bacterium]
MNSLKSSKWDLRFLNLSEFISNWSKDPSTKVGAVITDNNNRIISVGYNGFPQDIADNDRLENRETKYKIIVHGEMNAILFANRSLHDCTLYTYPFMPCPRCAGMVIQTGIKRVVSYNNMPERWANEFEISQQLFQEAGIELTLY